MFTLDQLLIYALYFNPYINFDKLCPFYGWENQGTVRLRNFPEVPIARIQIQYPHNRHFLSSLHYNARSMVLPEWHEPFPAGTIRKWESDIKMLHWVAGSELIPHSSCKTGAPFTNIFILLFPIPLTCHLTGTKVP